MSMDGSDESYMTMVLSELQLTDAIELVKHHMPDYYNDNDNTLVLNKFLDPVRLQNIVIIERVNAVIMSEPLTPKTLKLLGIRAELLVKLKKFRLALSDANDILKLDPLDVTALGIKAEALMGLNMFDAARAFLAPYLTLPSHKRGKLQELHMHAAMLSIQMHQGIYPWREISNRYRRAPEGFEGYNDWAEYEGRITIRDTTDGRGRGLFTKRGFRAGELILSSKAFGVFDNATKSLPPFPLLTELEINTLVKSIIRSLRYDPNACKLFYKLYAGPEFENASPPALNMFDEEHDFIDAKRVEAICKYNYFSEGSIRGVWGLPSYINHSCYDCNSSRMIYGDFMFIRAFKDIKADEEITIPYVCSENFAERCKVLEEYGITCTCSLCKFDRQEPKSVQDEKQELLAKLDTLETIVVESKRCYSEESMEKAVRLVDRLMELRPIFDMLLLPYSEQIGWHYYFKENFAKAFHYFVISYNAIKNSAGLAFEAYLVCKKIVEALLLADDREQATKWLDTLKHAATLAFGGDGVLEYRTLESWRHALDTRNDPKPVDSPPLPPPSPETLFGVHFGTEGPDGVREINGYGFISDPEE